MHAWMSTCMKRVTSRDWPPELTSRGSSRANGGAWPSPSTVVPPLSIREGDAVRMNDPTDWIADSRPKIEALCARRLAMCDDLLRYVLARIRPWSGRALDLKQYPHDGAL